MRRLGERAGGADGGGGVTREEVAQQLHSNYCDKFNTYDYGCRGGRCDCESDVLEILRKFEMETLVRAGVTVSVAQEKEGDIE